ncbi:hypothetical protein [Aestuariivivens sediminicola]|uniref:hypothetical protein n=1 Tax=Aestuariivivens sediminicola TaxID=2913560 RepID=UPI001F55F479|nr:hypothetical protein [Aestuariivivens sediminicola]
MNIKEKILTNDLRNNLKSIIQNEIKKMPETLDELDPKERTNVICRLMPYVFPKVETVHSKDGEPFSFD